LEDDDEDEEEEEEAHTVNRGDRWAWWIASGTW
jgi:hypothetical protein